MDGASPDASYSRPLGRAADEKDPKNHGGQPGRDGAHRRDRWHRHRRTGIDGDDRRHHREHHDIERPADQLSVHEHSGDDRSCHFVIFHVVTVHFDSVSQDEEVEEGQEERRDDRC